MYPNNPYIKHHAELAAIKDDNGNKADMGYQFDVFDKRHGLPHDDLLRAQYKHWRSVVTGADLLSVDEKKLLGL